MSFDPFQRHRGTAAAAVVDSKPVEEKPSPPPVKRKVKPLTAAELLDWIQHRWSKPFICLRDLQIYGPAACKDHGTALRLAETLEKNGWLAPVRAHRRDRRLWKTPRAIALGL
jgi:hypothetical protein